MTQSHNRALGAHEWGSRVRTMVGDAPCEGLWPDSDMERLKKSLMDELIIMLTNKI